MLFCYWLFVSGLFIYIFIKILCKEHVPDQRQMRMDLPREIGDWTKISNLGSGAFGVVMLWRNNKTNDSIAIKKCKFQTPSALSQKQKDRWHMEVDFMKSINHPNIINFKELPPELESFINNSNPSKLPILSMEYCTKGNLRKYLTNEPLRLCGLEEEDVRYILNDISSGLKYLHSNNITHRDIKPENIVLQHDDSRKQKLLFKIIDLGYAKELGDSTLSFVGTLHYLAPEIFLNQEYNYSVDYWSLGMMVFEIACGLLPFIPELTPYERYEKIKIKGPDDICLYMSYSGAITSSTELKRENFLTSCFKQNIEKWLKSVLQFNPANRAFLNDLDAFDYLHYILDKKIIKVFSVYKLELYSYEINDSTLLGTLKDWISRDIKVLKSDLLLLFCDECANEESTVVCHMDDDSLVESLLTSKDCIIYVYKKEAVFSDKPNQNIPNLIKELFSASNFQIKFAKPLYRQALFYVHTENQCIQWLKRAFLYLINYIEKINGTIQNQFIEAQDLINPLLVKIQKFCKEKHNKVSANEEIARCYNNYYELLLNLESSNEDLKNFSSEIIVLEEFQRYIKNSKGKIEDIFEKCDTRSLLHEINSKTFLLKENGETKEVILKRIRDVVSKTTKLKCNLQVKDANLKHYSKNFMDQLKKVQQLASRISNFIININELSNYFDIIEERYKAIITKAVKTEFILSFNQEETFQVVEENKNLRCQLEDLINKSVLAHKNYVQDFQC